MKKCSYCGKEYSDETETCRIDGEPLVVVVPPIISSGSMVAATPAKVRPVIYDAVPWYRREFAAVTALWMGFLCCPPALWVLGLLCLTGDIYYPSRRTGADLPKWSKGSKVRVWILIVVQVVIGIWFSCYQRKVIVQ